VTPWHSLLQAITDTYDAEVEEADALTSQTTTPKGNPAAVTPDSPGSEAKRRAVLGKLEGDDTVLDTGLRVRTFLRYLGKRFISEI
jgi:hypothetical protein